MATDSMMGSQTIAAQTQAWVKEVIMKYNICPFARREVERDSIRYTVCEESRMDTALQALLDECQYLDEHPQAETSLFILPRGYEGFHLYLDLLAFAEQLLFEEGYEGVYQLASFHPDYCFEGRPRMMPPTIPTERPIRPCTSYVKPVWNRPWPNMMILSRFPSATSPLPAARAANSSPNCCKTA